MIQPAGPGTAVTCPTCGHEDVYPGDASAEVITCDQCGARLAFGTVSPRWTNLPAADARFLHMSIDGHDVVVDRAFARAVALDILSVCPEPVAPTAPEPTVLDTLLCGDPIEIDVDDASAALSKLAPQFLYAIGPDGKQFITK